MKLPRENRRSSGILLVECMIYIGVLALLLGFAFTAFYHLHRQSTYLRRNTEDIARAMQAGERWRGEVRMSSEAEILENDGVEMLRLAHGTNEILYAFQNNKVWRKELPDEAWKTFLRDVNSSRMTIRNTEFSDCLVWEVELKGAQKIVRVKPLFSFLAVPGMKVEAE